MMLPLLISSRAASPVSRAHHPLSGQCSPVRTAWALRAVLCWAWARGSCFFIYLIFVLGLYWVHRFRCFASQYLMAKPEEKAIFSAQYKLLMLMDQDQHSRKIADGR